MRKLIGLVGLVGMIVGCSKSTELCEICGDYKVLNFSKVEVNQLTSPVQDYTFRRNLFLNDNQGTDEFSICSWNSVKPNKSWSRQQKKEIKVLNGNLNISQNGQWFWNLSTKEIIRTNNFKKALTITKINETVEVGTWKYVNDTHVEFRKLNQQNHTKKTVEVIGKCGQSIVIDNTIALFNENHPYLFEIESDNDQDELALKTTGNRTSSLVYDPEKSVYSFIGGSVWMTISRNSHSAQLAHRLMRSK